MLSIAAKHGDMLAVVVAGKSSAVTKRRQYSKWTYSQLAEQALAVAHGLLAAGFKPGERAVLMVPPSLNFYALTYGMVLAGVVPVLIDPGLGRLQLRKCLQEAEPTAFIGIPLAQAASLALGWGKETVQKRLTVGGQPKGWNGLTLDSVLALGRAHLASLTPAAAAGGPARLVSCGSAMLPALGGDDVAAIAFTSGSTGVAKGVMYKHKHFVAQVEMIRTSLGLEPGMVDMSTFAPFALFDPALGATAVLPCMDWRRPAKVDPVMLLELIEEWQVNNVFGSPGLFATVTRHATKHGVKWPSCVRRVLSAGAPVPVAVLEAMHVMLPEHAEVLTPYGATECLPVTVIDSRTLLQETRMLTDAGAGVCVGRPVAPNDVRVIQTTDDPITSWADARELTPGQVGEIVVLGPTTTETYLKRAGANAGAKISTSDGRIIHRMGDVGYFDHEGRLWYCGRKSHRVQLAGGRTLYTAQVEEVLNAHPAVFRSALVGVKLPTSSSSSGGGNTDKADTVTPVVCIELHHTGMFGPPVNKSKLFAELKAMCDAHPTSAGIDIFLLHPGLPVDIRHNAKITRELVGPWAAQQLGAGKAQKQPGCLCIRA